MNLPFYYDKKALFISDSSSCLEVYFAWLNIITPAFLYLLFIWQYLFLSFTFDLYVSYI